MKKKTKILLGAIVATMILATAGVAANSVSAADSSHQSLVNEIATKFNLKPADVQAVFDSHKQEVEADHQQKMTDALDKAVSDGQLTSAQKDLIVAEQATIKSRMDDIAKITDKTQRQAAMKQLQADIQAWAKANGIDMKWVHAFGGPGKGRGMRMMGGKPAPQQ